MCRPRRGALLRRPRHTPDQIIGKLAECHRLLASGQELDTESARFKKLVANQAPDIDMLRESSADGLADVECGRVLVGVAELRHFQVTLVGGGDDVSFTETRWRGPVARGGSR